VLSKLAYLAVCRSIQLLVRLARGDAAKDLEILVLRHQLSVLRRQTPRPRLQPADRALLAAVSRVLPRSRWSCFLVQPETLLRWHRRLVAGAWTYPHRQTGRPPLDPDVQQLIVRLATENPRWGYQRTKESCNGLASTSQRPRSARHSAATGSTPRHDGRPRRGRRSRASKPPGSWPATSSPSIRSGCGGCRCCSSSSSTADGSISAG
jgi:putative transposase